MRNKGFFKTALCAGAIAAASIFNPLQAYSQEVKQESRSTEQTLEKKVQKPLVKITSNFNFEIPQENTTSSISSNSYFYFSTTNPSLDKLYLGSGLPVTTEETIEVEGIMKGIRNGSINSYQALVGSFQNLSEIQRIILLAAIGGTLGSGTYSASLWNNPVFSQDAFFLALQNYLSTGNQNPLGVCRQLSSNLEQTSNDAGTRAAAVSGARRTGPHAFDILKLENGTAIIDYSRIFLVSTKNIEEALEMYQRADNTAMFEHLFHEDALFKYQLITKDGKKLLDFTGYDETSEKLKNSLTEMSDEPVFPNPYLTVNFDNGNYSSSGEINLFGLFAKIGEIRGSPSSAMDIMKLYQFGYKNKFLLWDFLNVAPSASVVFGSLPSDAYNQNPCGFLFDIGASTNNKTGFNLSSRIARCLFTKGESNLLYTFSLEAGASYKLPVVKEFEIEPYLVFQFNDFPLDIGTYEYILMPNEIRAGMIATIKPSLDTKISIEPYYVRRIWENEFGAEAKFETKDFGIDAKGYFSGSTYDFCPDKWGVDVGAHVNLKNLKFGIKYGLKGTNYDGEIGNDNFLSFGINAGF